MFTDRLFSSSPTITSLRWRSINPSPFFFLSRALEGLRRENRGSVNWLGEFRSSTKRKVEHFHTIVAQQRQKTYVKKCAAVFCRSRCLPRRRCLNPLTTAREEGNTQSTGLWRNTLFKKLDGVLNKRVFYFLFSLHHCTSSTTPFALSSYSQWPIQMKFCASPVRIIQ